MWCTSPSNTDCPDLAGLLNFACDPANFEARNGDCRFRRCVHHAMRKPKAPEANRARILAAAIAEFASRGFKGASMDAIAARTNTTRALINYYFRSKEQLYLAVLERVYAEIREAEKELDLDHLPPVQAIRRIVEFTYNYYVEHEDFVRLVVAENQAKGRHMRRSPALKTVNRPIVARSPPCSRAARQTARFDLISTRSTSIWRLRLLGCSTSPTSTPSAPSSSGPWAPTGTCPPPPDGGGNGPALAQAGADG